MWTSVIPDTHSWNSSSARHHLVDLPSLSHT